MNIREAIDIIERTGRFRAKQYYEHRGNGGKPNRILEEEIEALGISLHVLEYAEKYKWHDLRNNPDDLPMHDGMYIVAQQYIDDPVKTGFGQYENMYGYGYGWSALTSYGHVIAWREIEPFEVS